MIDLQEHKERACAGLRKLDEANIPEPYAFISADHEVSDISSIAGVTVLFSNNIINKWGFGTYCPVQFIPVWNEPVEWVAMQAYLGGYELWIG